MASTNKTDNIYLSQFIDTDKPTFRGDYNGDMRKIDAAVAQANVNITTAITQSREATERVDTIELRLNQIPSERDAEISKERAERENAINGVKTQISDLSNVLDARFQQHYTIAQANDIFERKNTARGKNGHMVMIGSSNSVQSTLWPDKLANLLKMEIHNYSVGGGGFTAAGNAGMLAQLNAATADTSFPKDQVKLFIVADAGNDVRADNKVYETAKDVLDKARANYPEARILVVPGLVGQATLNANSAVASSYFKRVYELMEAGIDAGAEILSGSHTWHADNSALMRRGEVHYTYEGNARIASLVAQCYNGGPSFLDHAVTGLGTTTAGVNANGKGFRSAGTVQYTIILESGNTIPPGDHARIPEGFRPAETWSGVGLTGGGDWVPVQVYPNGTVRTLKQVAQGQGNLQVTATYTGWL